MFLFYRTIIIDDPAHVDSFFPITPGEETALEPIDNDAFELTGGESEIIHRQLEFVGQGSVGHQPVVGANGGGKLEFIHTAEGVVGDRGKRWVGVQVRS